MFYITYKGTKYKIKYEWSGEDYYFRIMINNNFFCFYDLDVDNYFENDEEITDEKIKTIIKNEIKHIFEVSPSIITYFVEEL